MMQELPTVRVAQPGEEDALMAMCRRLHAENGLFSFSEKKVRKIIEDGTLQRNLTIIGVIGPVDKDNKPCGPIEASICVLITQAYYTEDNHVGELWNFVDEPYRNSRNAAALIDFGKRSARIAKLIFIAGIITSKQMAGKVRLYRKLIGRPPAGAFFVDNSDWNFDPISDHNDLAKRLKEAANQCTTKPRTITFDVAQKKVAPLLREAAEAVNGEDRLWGAL